MAETNQTNPRRRQSSLFSFGFQKKAKEEQLEDSRNVDDVENIPISRKSTPQNSKQKGISLPRENPKTKADANPGTPQRIAVDKKRTQESTASPICSEPVILDSDDEQSRGIGFMNCTTSSTPPPKRRRVILSSDEEGENDEANDGKTADKSAEKARKQAKYSDNDDESDEELMESRNRSDREGKGKQRRQSQGGNTSIGGLAQSYINSFCFDTSQTPQTCNFSEKKGKGSEDLLGNKTDENDSRKELETEEEHFPHLDFTFLKPDKIKDANGRKSQDPEYDGRTLFVPDEFLKQQTPGHQQWWRLKSRHYDTVLFFKVGKFYELYHMDAVIAVENLGLTYMRGKYAHCGFPEVGYGRFADQLVNRGYKVARVEQTETPKQLEERQKKTAVKEKEKVVRREICRVTTLGTKTYGILDGTDQRELDGANDPDPKWLMAITERLDGVSVRYGVCFVDCTVGVFKLSEFEDDQHQSNLRTLIAHNYPTQLLIEKGSISHSTTSLLNTMLSNVPKEFLFSKRQFLSSEKTLALLCEDRYFGSNIISWPEEIRNMLADQQETIPTPGKDHQLALSSFGAILWYLQLCLVDVDAISMRQIHQYSPPSVDWESVQSDSNSNAKSFWRDKHLVLDGACLLNLHILPDFASSGGLTRAADRSIQAFSLFDTVNYCHSAFGRRLLKQWISAPSCDCDVLLERQKAIGWLISDRMRQHATEWRECLRKIPDLERFFQRIHTIGLKYRSNEKGGHPDSRAQLFESDKYNKRKIRDLIIVLDGLENILQLVDKFTKSTSSAEENLPVLLQKCILPNITEMSEDLKFFQKAFDRESALKNGVILPHKGVDQEYDLACEHQDQCRETIDSFLFKMKKKLKCQNIKYVGTGKNAYQLEVPESHCDLLSTDFQLVSKRKGFKRYTSPELQQMIASLADAESKCDLISSEVTRRVFADFDIRKDNWSSVLHQMATLDCLLSLAHYAQNSVQQMCFPEFILDSPQPILAIQRGFHPSLIAAKLSTSFDYIPNNCFMGGDGRPTSILLTGPNMGGKSTFMRQIANLVLLAQIGSMIPAISMKLTPVDRIFCRIGASDRLSAGQSTFFVELSETNTILRQATRHSLVLIDELGRGTSTYDGMAIASAVLKYIVNKVQCRMLFSTHYYSLCKFFTDNPLIKFAHMACMVENADADSDATMEAITFLYTLADGMSNKSYGFFTAKMAGIDVEIIRKAFEASKLFEIESK